MASKGTFQLVQAPHQLTYFTPTTPKKKPNFFEALLPSLAGLGGGLAGAAAGTAILPGVGTLIGALLGGAAGGGGGKVAENAVTHNKLTSGVGPEALEQGVLSAGPIRLVKAATTGIKAIRAGEDLTDALNAASTAPGVTTRLRSAVADKGRQMEARAGGFGIGEKLSGQPALGYYESKQIGENLAREGIKPGAPETRIKAVQDALNTRGQTIDRLVKANNSYLPAGTRDTVINDYMKSIEKQPGVTDTVRKSAANLAKNFRGQVRNTKSLINFRRGLDSQVIAFNRNPDAKMAADQLAARTFRDVLSRQTNKLVPGIKSANTSYHNLTQALEYLKGGAKAISDQSQGGGGIVSRVLTNDTAQAAKSRAGAALQRAETTASEDAAPFTAGKIAKRTLPVGTVQAAGASLQPAPQEGGSDTSSLVLPVGPTTDEPATSTAYNPFDPANVEANIPKLLAAGGSMQDVQNYVSLAAALNSLQTSNEKPLNSTQQQQANNAVSALTDIQNLSQAIQNDPSVLVKDAIPGGGLARRLTGTTDYDAAKQNIVDVIARLRSGAAISADEAKRYMSLLPGSTDTQQAAMDKLQRLASLLQAFANPQPSGADLSTLGV